VEPWIFPRVVCDCIPTLILVCTHGPLPYLNLTFPRGMVRGTMGTGGNIKKHQHHSPSTISQSMMMHFGPRSDPIDGKRFCKFRTIPPRNRYSGLCFAETLFHRKRISRQGRVPRTPAPAADSPFLPKKDGGIRGSQLSVRISSR
jgi:hypothetical protein